MENQYEKERLSYKNSEYESKLLTIVNEYK